MRTSAFLFVVSQEGSKRATTYPQGQCVPGQSADPSRRAGWGKQTAGKAILALRRQTRFSCISGTWHLPQDGTCFLNRGKESGFTSCMAVYNTGAICMETPTNAQLELCSLELKRHTDTQASIRDTLHRQGGKGVRSNRGAVRYSHSCFFISPLLPGVQAGSALQKSFEVPLSSAEGAMISAPLEQSASCWVTLCVYRKACINLYG